MKLSGIHILLTYQCTFECDHCFVWGSPWQCGTLTLKQIGHILAQAKDTGTVDWIFFEGGEPFLYYAVMLEGIRRAYEAGFHVGVVSNAYWANDLEDALAWLQPLAGFIQDLSISSDLFHYSERMSQQAQNAIAAARELGISVGTISVAQPEDADASRAKGQLPSGESAVMYRGRAASSLVPRTSLQPWDQFTRCPHEDLRNPGRIHLDPLGNLHICQGIVIGNLFEKPLKEICKDYVPETHPICGPLLAGGPVALVSEYNLPHDESYADACHLCYRMREAMRERLPEVLGPNQVYGIME